MINIQNKQHSYQDAMKIELKFEGGKDDDPVDPGGRTNQGVIQREYSAWLRRQGKLNQDVFNMTPQERDAIYKENYADKVRYDELPPGIDLLLLDGAINSGVSQSIKWLQRALGLTPDGVMGNLTLQAIYNSPDDDLLITKICDRRMAFLRSLKTFYHFGSGWTSRVNQLKKTCQLWASGSIGPEVVWEANMNKKASLIDAKPLLSTAPADATASGGAITTGLTTAQTTLAPLADSSHLIGQIATALIVLGVLATAFGFAYSWYVRRQNGEINDALNLVPIVGSNDNNNIPTEVISQYQDPDARGGATGNIAPGVVTASGRTAGDTETRVNPAAAIPYGKLRS
jgi:lysozyme family protein